MERFYYTLYVVLLGFKVSLKGVNSNKSGTFLSGIAKFSAHCSLNTRGQIKFASLYRTKVYLIESAFLLFSVKEREITTAV